MITMPRHLMVKRTNTTEDMENNFVDEEYSRSKMTRISTQYHEDCIQTDAVRKNFSEKDDLSPLGTLSSSSNENLQHNFKLKETLKATLSSSLNQQHFNKTYTHNAVSSSMDYGTKCSAKGSPFSVIRSTKALKDISNWQQSDQLDSNNDRDKRLTVVSDDVIACPRPASLDSGMFQTVCDLGDYTRLTPKRTYSQIIENVRPHSAGAITSSTDSTNPNVTLSQHPFNIPKTFKPTSSVPRSRSPEPAAVIFRKSRFGDHGSPRKIRSPKKAKSSVDIDNYKENVPPRHNVYHRVETQNTRSTISPYEPISPPLETTQSLDQVQGGMFLASSEDSRRVRLNDPQTNHSTSQEFPESVHRRETNYEDHYVNRPSRVMSDDRQRFEQTRRETDQGASHTPGRETMAMFGSSMSAFLTSDERCDSAKDVAGAVGISSSIGPTAYYTNVMPFHLKPESMPFSHDVGLPTYSNASVNKGTGFVFKGSNINNPSSTEPVYVDIDTKCTKGQHNENIAVKWSSPRSTENYTKSNPLDTANPISRDFLNTKYNQKSEVSQNVIPMVTPNPFGRNLKTSLTASVLYSTPDLISPRDDFPTSDKTSCLPKVGLSPPTHVLSNERMLPSSDGMFSYYKDHLSPKPTTNSCSNLSPEPLRNKFMPITSSSPFLPWRPWSRFEAQDSKSAVLIKNNYQFDHSIYHNGNSAFDESSQKAIGPYNSPSRHDEIADEHKPLDLSCRSDTESPSVCRKDLFETDNHRALGCTDIVQSQLPSVIFHGKSEQTQSVVPETEFLQTKTSIDRENVPLRNGECFSVIKSNVHSKWTDSPAQFSNSFTSSRRPSFQNRIKDDPCHPKAMRDISNTVYTRNTNSIPSHGKFAKYFGRDASNISNENFDLIKDRKTYEYQRMHPHITDGIFQSIKPRPMMEPKVEHIQSSNPSFANRLLVSPTVNWNGSRSDRKRHGSLHDGSKSSKRKCRDRPPLWGVEIPERSVTFYECEEKQRFCDQNSKYQVPDVPASHEGQAELKEALLRLYANSDLPPVPSDLRRDCKGLRFFPLMQTLFQASLVTDIEKLRMAKEGLAFENFNIESDERKLNQELDKMLEKREDGSYYCLSRKSIDPAETQCGFVADNIGKMRRHVKNHLAEKKWVCCFCRVQMTDQTDMERHGSTHTRLRPFRCSDCGKPFTQKVTLINHMKTTHGAQVTADTNRDRYTCRQCGVYYSAEQRQECIDHLKTFHFDTEFQVLQKRKRFPFNLLDVNQGFDIKHNMSHHLTT